MSKNKKIRTGSKKSSRYNPKELKEQILNFLNNNLSNAYSAKQIIKKLGLRDQASKAAVQPLLISLENEEKVQKLRNSYRSISKPEVVTGKVDHVNQRFAYVVTNSEFGDIWVKSDDLKFAMDGDTVEVAVLRVKHGKRPEGRVINVIQRGKDEIVGRIEFSPRFAFVVADNRKIYKDFFIRMDDVGKAAHHDKVIIKITGWPALDKSPEGKVIRVLGKAGEHEAEIHSIMAEFDLPFEFPESVEAEANVLSEQLAPEEIKRRRDFRDIPTFTIDPVDAKDFDDALSVKPLENGHLEVGIHIADVTYYVSPKTQLEREAAERATSVYLVDRTIPMLPERLSNGLCSLRPNEDKFTFSAVFELDQSGHIHKEWFGRTVIHSDRRFSYEEAQEIIEGQAGDYQKEMLQLNELALKLRKQRFREGAINFETREVRFQLAEDGTPLGVTPRIRKDAHKLVEEFMLLANRRVAQFVYDYHKGKAKNTFVYRTHDYPDPEKVNTFAQFAKKFGHDMKLGEGQVSNSINALISEIEGQPEENVLQQLAIRAMSKAKYTTSPDIHFGLAFQHYTHFTSPIRRYPDMMVHRLLQRYLDELKPVEPAPVEEQCIHSSEREKRAADAERASIKFKQVEFMRNAEDRPYPGVVTGVTEWGLFVEIIETSCEGLVRMTELGDDYYEFDEDHYRVVGRNNKRIITLGDELVVRVIGTDIDRRTIDLALAED